MLSQIPGSTAAAAFAANITLDETGLTGFAAGAYLEAYPQGGSTSTSFMNFGPNQIIANAGVISLNQTNGEFSVVASAPSQVIVDTYGVFIAPQATALDCTDVSGPSTSIAASANGAASAPACASGYTRVTVSCIGSSYGLNLVTSRVDNGICTYSNTGGATSIEADSHCCRVPGR